MTNNKYDLYAEVGQSISDKILTSVRYPFKIINKQRPFPGCNKSAIKIATEENDYIYTFTQDEIRSLLNDSVAEILSREDFDTDDISISDDVYNFGGNIIQQAKHIINIANTENSYEGPDIAELQSIVDGGIKGLVDTLGNWKVYAHCSNFSVVVEDKPTINLRSPQVDLSNVKIKIAATGELWVKYPWWNCYRYCFKWKKIIKCERIARVSISLKIKADANAIFKAEAAKVLVYGKFNKLRLDYPILEKINFEKYANKALENKPVFVYDAAKFITVIPLLESRFSIDSITLPNNNNGLSIEISLQQI